MQVDRKILDDDQLSFCKEEAETYFDEMSIPISPNNGSSANSSYFGGLSGGAYYDRVQNTIFTPNNIFWARFNRMRVGGSGTLRRNCLRISCAILPDS
jgi:hypothetical protein